MMKSADSPEERLRIAAIAVAHKLSRGLEVAYHDPLARELVAAAKEVAGSTEGTLHDLRASIAGNS